MISVTFTRSDGGTDAVTVDCNVVYGTDFYTDRLNQITMETIDGGDVVQDNGPNKTKGLLVMKNMSKAHGLALRTWLKTKVLFEKERFTIAAIPKVNLGKGDNVAITNARYDGGPTDNGIFEFAAPGYYHAKFPYKFLD